MATTAQTRKYRADKKAGLITTALCTQCSAKLRQDSANAPLCRDCWERGEDGRAYMRGKKKESRERKKMTTKDQTEQQTKLVEAFGSATIATQKLADQVRELKAFVNAEFAEDYPLSQTELEDWRKAALRLSGSIRLSVKSVERDTEGMDEFLTQQK